MRGVWLARGMCSVTIAVAVTRLVLAIVDPASSNAASARGRPGGGIPVAAFEAVVLVMLAVIGAVVASRQPRNAVGWILCVLPLTLGLLILSAHLYWSLNLHGHGSALGAELVAWLASWIWIPAMLPTLTLFPLLFPTGRPPTPRWRWIIWMTGAAGILEFVGEAGAPGRFQDYPVENPLSAGVAAEVSGGVGYALMAVAALASLASLVVRFRRSHGDERQQVKWVVVAAVLFVFLFVASCLIQNVLGAENLGFEAILFGWLAIASAVAVAMLRYRLYDIDVVINRTLVYGALTATLASTYLGCVLLLQLLLERFTAGSGLAVAASTLATAALVRPARARIQEVVDRRFYRSKYDAARTLEVFGSRLRDEVDLEALQNDLRSVVAETMRPAHVTLWLRTH